MDEALAQSSATGSDKSLMAALIVMARYLDKSDPAFGGCLSASIAHAEAAGLSPADLKALHVIAGSIGRTRA